MNFRVQTTPSDLAAWMQACRDRIEGVLDALLPPVAIAPARLHEAMRYAVLGGGKRVRPLLAYAAGEAAGADPLRVDRAAAAVELIHAYSLVHDDLPSMDNDVLRRGQPTVHVKFDEATALLVGDALQSLAFEALTESGLATRPEDQIGMLAALARAAGSRGMAGGQAVDLASQGKALSVEELEFMHVHKTGALIACSVSLGAACGTMNAEELRGALHFARFMGLAFQVVDDVLDATESTETLGKTAGKDAAGSKPTYASAMGVERARAHADALLDDALSGLAPLGDRARRLADLGRYIVTRNS